jgi:hypothetical protein
MKPWLDRWLSRPGASQALRLAGKLLLLQVFIEIPFMILEAGLLLGAVAGGGLVFWKSALLVVGVYLLIESGLWLLQRWRGSPTYRWFESERLLLGWAWNRVRSAIRVTF